MECYAIYMCPCEGWYGRRGVDSPAEHFKQGCSETERCRSEGKTEIAIVEVVHLHLEDGEYVPV